MKRQVTLFLLFQIFCWTAFFNKDHFFEKGNGNYAPERTVAKDTLSSKENVSGLGTILPSHSPHQIQTIKSQRELFIPMVVREETF